MAFPVAPRLSEVRRAVAVRLSMGPQAEQSSSFRDKLDEYIRMSFHEIVNEADFLVLRTRLEIDFIDRQHGYDMPDGMRGGDIDLVYAVGVTGDEVQIHAGVQEYERSAWKEPPVDPDNPTEDPGTRKSLPRRYEIVDGVLNVYPAPDVKTWPSMRIEGQRMPPEPQENDDRIEVDKEALIRLSVAYGKADLRHPDARDMMARYQTYIAQVQANETEGEVIRIGGHFSEKFNYSTRRTTPGGPDRSRYPYWTPF